MRRNPPPRPLTARLTALNGTTNLRGGVALGAASSSPSEPSDSVAAPSSSSASSSRPRFPSNALDTRAASLVGRRYSPTLITFTYNLDPQLLMKRVASELS